VKSSFDSDSGILFKNDRRTSDSAPDYKGNIHVECEQCGHRSHRTLAAWIKVARNGSKFMSLSFKPRQVSTTTQDDSEDSF